MYLIYNEQGQLIETADEKRFTQLKKVDKDLFYLELKKIPYTAPKEDPNTGKK
jgi:hypothetical protein